MCWIFVCSNNLVRSVLAEAICRELAPHLKVDSVGLADGCEQQRNKDGHWVKSRGKPLSPVMRAFLSERHIGFPERRARRLTDTDVREADVIWVMTVNHRHDLLDRFPEAEGKVHLLGGSAIKDNPKTELTDERLQEWYDQIKSALKARVANVSQLP
jgi:protein-tyrosine-phosphatase